MNFFSNLFGKKPESSKQSHRQSASDQLPGATIFPAEPNPIDPSNNKNMIRVFDDYGREFLIPKEKWRTDVLPGTIKSNWNNAEALYTVIFGALNDGFHSDVAAAAERLYKTDPIPSRGACVWGIVLMDEGRLDEAEKVFRDFIANHGEDGSILTNLAKVYSKRKNNSKAEEILWHGLEVDSNQNNGLLWYRAICHEREGEQGAQAALRRVASLQGSWRAQVWLARLALQSGNFEQALTYYHESLSHAGKPAPADILMQISGDLGNAGKLQELLRLVEPQFVAEVHGLQVGNNLIKAHFDLGHLDAARGVLDELYSLKRPDWQKTLSYWDTELAKKRLASENSETSAAPQISMLAFEGPVWLNPASRVAGLFPRNLPDAVGVCFLGSTAAVATDSDRVQHQLADDKGRMSRVLPLFLAEQAAFNSNARVQTLEPWIAEPVGGFVLIGEPWSDEEASKSALQTDLKSDYAVVTHLDTRNEPWTIDLRLIRTTDAKRIGNLTCSFPSTKPEESIPEMARQLLKLLTKETAVKSRSPIKSYEVPSGENFPFYLLRLEQLLAVRCAGMDGVPKDFLNGAREIVDGNIQLCLSCPLNINTRILLAQTLLTLKKARPDILPEFKEKLALLQKQKPLAEPAGGIIQQMFSEAIA
jgi:tetratricopeptide (TPR) repeat protein